MWIEFLTLMIEVFLLLCLLDLSHMKPIQEKKSVYL